MARLKCDLNRAMGQLANGLRFYSTRTAVRPKNLYEILGVTRAATATEVKGAYYKLSMQFHPDKNGDCLEAADKFRQITEAYEVLGNFRLRKLYDKGMLHTAGENYHKVNESPEEDDATTRFYKARMKNTTGKGATGGSGRTPIYDFDEWTNSHYGDELKRQQKLKHQAAYKKERIVTVKSQMKAELVMLIFLMMLMGLCAMTGKSLDVDVVTEKKKPLVHQK